MKIAIVTGASSGMGREFVRQIDRYGQSLDEVWVIARRKERLEALRKKSGLPLRVLEGDLLKDTFFERLEELLRENTPEIRILVNAAGFGKSGRADEIFAEDMRIQMEMIRLNCEALTGCAGSACRIFQGEAGSSIWLPRQRFVPSRTLRFMRRQNLMCSVFPEHWEQS